MRHTRLALIISMIILVLQGCGASPFPADSVASPGGDSDPSEVVITPGTLFAVHVFTAPESDPDSFTLQKSCEIPEGTALGTTLNCTATIPEGTLHFSKLKLQVTVPSGTACEFARFEPYFYQASVGASFQPEWENDEIVCDGTEDPIPRGCFSGPAIDIVPDFPRYTGIYITPDGQPLQEAWTIDSANERYRVSGNRWTNNTLLVRTGNLTTASGRDGYIANTMQDWSFECRDRWFDLNYKVALTIQDEDTGGPACDPNLDTCNQFTNWNSTQPTDPQ